jgi:hypothetical protein
MKIIVLCVLSAALLTACPIHHSAYAPVGTLELPKNCQHISNLDGSETVLCECVQCGKEQAGDGVSPVPYKCQVQNGPDGKPVLFCGYDEPTIEKKTGRT